MRDSEMYLHDVGEQDIEVVTVIKVGEAWFNGNSDQTVVIFEGHSLQEMISWGQTHEGTDKNLDEFQEQSKKFSRVFTMTRQAELDLLGSLIVRAISKPETRPRATMMALAAVQKSAELSKEEK